MGKKNSWLIIILVIAIGVITYLFYTSTPSIKENGTTEARILSGKWVRQDGGYTLHLEDIKHDGSLKAYYFNPKSINVGKANWEVVGKNLSVFVKLQDVNYPGSKYTLIYIKDKDVLAGTYYQATSKQTFEVYFLREQDKNLVN